jgi:TolA-binding protein
MTGDPLDTLQRQVQQLQREVTDLKQQVEHECHMRGFLEERVTRAETYVHGKISRSEAIALLWIALPIIFVVVALLAIALVTSKPHP